MNRNLTSPARSSDAEPTFDYVLLTGATGLVGQYLIKDLLLAGQRLAVIVRPAKRLDVGQRVGRWG